MSITKDAIKLLQELIATPSISREEDKTADIIDQFLVQKNILTHRKGNNVWALSKKWDNNLPTVLLNSHHDTVKPVAAWTRDPFSPDIEGDQLFGLGSNDAGASLVALLTCFVHFYNQDLPFNLIMAATAEEEISGANGIASIIPDLPKIDFGIVGEPTQMRMAIAEKGLMVVDAYAKGESGHAARSEGVNAIYKATKDIQWIQHHEFNRTSNFLGKTKMTVTQINAGTQHNVVPDNCHFVIDVRTNELYSNQEVFTLLRNHLESEVKARSFRLNSSKIVLSHPLVQTGMNMGLKYYGSPTLSDQALLSFPTLKIGCGKSERSHTANEFILLSEIEHGIQTYIDLIGNLAVNLSEQIINFPLLDFIPK